MSVPKCWLLVFLFASSFFSLFGEADGHEEKVVVASEDVREFLKACSEYESCIKRTPRGVGSDPVGLRTIAGNLAEKLGEKLFHLPPEVVKETRHAPSMQMAAIALLNSRPEQVRQFFAEAIQNNKCGTQALGLLPLEQIRELIQLETQSRELKPVFVRLRSLFADAENRGEFDGTPESAFVEQVLSLDADKRNDFSQQYVSLYLSWPANFCVSQESGDENCSRLLAEKGVSFSYEFIRWVVLSTNSLPTKADRQVCERAVLMAARIDKRQDLVTLAIDKAVNQKINLVKLGYIVPHRSSVKLPPRKLEKLILLNEPEAYAQTDRKPHAALRNKYWLQWLVGHLVAAGDESSVLFLETLAQDERFPEHLREHFSENANSLKKRLEAGAQTSP